MPIIDKNGLLNKLSTRNPVIIEIGCGPQKKTEAAIGIDAISYPGVDIVGDVFDVLAQLPTESVDVVQSFHFVEHVTDFNRLVGEMCRILKSGGTLLCVAPHFSNPYFYSDYTHQKFFGLYSFSYLATEDFLKRKTPKYGIEAQLRLVDIKLIFTSPFPGRRRIKKLLEKAFNINPWAMEFYEENLCHILPCYEVRYQLVKT